MNTEITDLIKNNKLSESELVELKEITSEWKESCCSISAMLNKNGHGYIIFDLKDNAEICKKFTVSDKTIKNITSKITNSILPRPILKTRKENYKDGQILLIEVEDNKPPYSCNHYYYYRVSSTNQHLIEDELRTFF